LRLVLGGQLEEANSSFSVAARSCTGPAPTFKGFVATNGPRLSTPPDTDNSKKESPRHVSMTRVILQWFENHLAVAFLPVPKTDACPSRQLTSIAFGSPIAESMGKPRLRTFPSPKESLKLDYLLYQLVR